MALAFATHKMDPNSDAVRVVPGRLYQSLTSVTLDGSYAAGGVVLTPVNLGMVDAVYYGVATIRTPEAASGTAVQAVLDCSNPAAPKLKLNTATGEVAAASNSGAVIDVLAYGY